MKLRPREPIRSHEFHQFYNVGEDVVRVRIAEGHYTGQRLEYANEWLLGCDTGNDRGSSIFARMANHPLIVGGGAGISAAIFIAIVGSEALF